MTGTALVPLGGGPREPKDRRAPAPEVSDPRHLQKLEVRAPGLCAGTPLQAQLRERPEEAKQLTVRAPARTEGCSAHGPAWWGFTRGNVGTLSPRAALGEGRASLTHTEHPPEAQPGSSSAGCPAQAPAQVRGCERGLRGGQSAVCGSFLGGTALPSPWHPTVYSKGTQNVTGAGGREGRPQTSLLMCDYGLKSPFTRKRDRSRALGLVEAGVVSTQRW